MGRLFSLVVLVLASLACSSTAIATRVFSLEGTPADRQPIPATGSSAFVGCGGVPIDQINADYEQAIVEETNQIRMKAGLTPLKRVDDLNHSARYHAADMSHDNYFSHDTFDRHENRIVEVCDTWQRIESFYTDWLALAENIAAGQTRPAEAMDGWMNSPDHRHNILSENYSEIGVGFYKGDGQYKYYWVQNFGKKSGRYPIVINGEQAATQSREVNLYIYGDWDKVRLRNNQEEWGPWMPFSNTMNWTLPDKEGAVTVSAELRAGNQSYQTSDSIQYLP